MSAPIGVVGAGAWGTALAQVLASDGTPVLLWAREPEVVDAINAERRNPLFLPSATLHDPIRATSAIADLRTAKALLIVVPAQHIGSVLDEMAPGTTPLVLCAKGIEAQSGRLMTEVARFAAPQAPLSVLSGPSFAHEVAAGLPTAVTLACENESLWERLHPLIARPTLRPYYSDDLIGAEIGGAVKNVLAIACGVVEGARLGQNARAAVIARGFAEMTRFGLAKDARAETLAGLSGLGDLVLTCSSVSSRNFSLGVGLGQGRPAAELLADRLSVAEGAFTAPVLAREAEMAGVDMPVTRSVCQLISGERTVREVIQALLTRPLAREATTA